MIYGVIYRYVSPSGKSYIGQTTDEHKRRLCFNDKKYYSGSRMDNAIKKYGADKFIYEVLFRGEYNSLNEAVSDLNQKEQEYIEKYDSYNNGYNMTVGGEGVRGLSQSQTSINKMKKGLKEYYKTHENHFKGKKHSSKTKKILSEIAKKRTGEKAPMYGKHLSEKQKQILSDCAKQRIGDKNAFFNKKHKESTKLLISKANSKAVCQIDIHTNEVIQIFSSALEAGKYLGNPRLNSEIVKCCRNYVSPSGRHYITCKGYKWKYQEQ
jgi:group I intron endonuclease